MTEPVPDNWREFEGRYYRTPQGPPWFWMTYNPAGRNDEIHWKPLSAEERAAYYRYLGEREERRRQYGLVDDRH